MIYLDNAATTLHKPPQVARAVVQAMDTMGNAARGAHDGALEASRTMVPGKSWQGFLLVSGRII